MTYEEAMQFWFGRVNFEQKSPTPNDLKLDQMRQLLARLGGPQRRMRIVHVAGSKGKGSTSAMLADILRAEGYRVGLFTSPHLVEVEERIQVDRTPIARTELADLMSEIREVASRPEAGRRTTLADELTFFEIATALALLHFVRRRVEWAVLEVGLGGRFDSTNVCVPEVAVITSISFDHMQQLGTTIPRIAGEKAGIIKPGRPTVSGSTAPEARAVIEATALRVGSPLRQAGVDYRWTHRPARFSAGAAAGAVLPAVAVSTWRRSWPELALRLVGEHQAANAALALAVIDVLGERGTPISDRAVRQGLAQVQWPARLERFGDRPTIVLDCAHNVASAEALVRALDVSFPDARRRLLLFAGSRDKDLAGMLRVFAPRFDRIVLTAFRNNPRGADAAALLDLAPKEHRSKMALTRTSSEGLAAIRSLAQPEDLIAIAGSVFLAGELWPVLRAETAH